VLKIVVKKSEQGLSTTCQLHKMAEVIGEFNDVDSRKQ
jgi:hypothetical protein